MRLFDYSCPTCGYTERDVNVPYGQPEPALLHVDNGTFSAHTAVMVRQYAAPPQIWNTGGRGGQ